MCAPGNLEWQIRVQEEREKNYVANEFPEVPVLYRNVPPGELAVHRGARVEATDGYVGQVGRLLINPDTMQVTHLVLEEGQIGRRREMTIPVSQIDHVVQDTVYLKMDRVSVEALPATPTRRWLGPQLPRK